MYERCGPSKTSRERGGVLLWRILQWSMGCGKSYSIALKSSAVIDVIDVNMYVYRSYFSL